MLLSIIVLFFLPWIDTNPIKSIRYRSTLFKVNLFIFVIAFMILGWLGVKAVTPLYSELALRFSQVYFLFFILLYFYSSSRNKIFSYIFTATILGIIFIYDFFRLTGADLTYLSVGFLSLVLYVIFMFMSPIFTQLNSEKQVPSRVT